MVVLSSSPRSFKSTFQYDTPPRPFPACSLAYIAVILCRRDDSNEGTITIGLRVTSHNNDALQRVTLMLDESEVLSVADFPYTDKWHKTPPGLPFYG